jgi:hypothetical protein
MGLWVLKLEGYWAFNASKFNAITVMIPQLLLVPPLAVQRFILLY